jgi:transposase InsO family protein
LYYLHQARPPAIPHERLPRSTRTIWRILHQYGRIAPRSERRHRPIPRPQPLTVWQLDFKDASTVPADPDGKHQHVVEVLNTVDAGTSLLLNAQARDDFTAETTLRAVAETLQAQGCPEAVMIDRDPRFVGSTRQRDCPSPFERFWLCLGVAVTVLPPRRPDLNCFVERYHRAYEEECLRIFQPTDLGQVREVTDRFRQHYNEERPHQGQACGNQPPRVALAARTPAIPPRPPVPAVVDPDRWVAALDGRRYVRKVTKGTRVTVDGVPYYLARALVGKYVSLRVEAATREFVVEEQEREVQRVPIKGLGHAPLPFDAYVEWMCEEARRDRLHPDRGGGQLRLPL